MRPCDSCQAPSILWLDFVFAIDKRIWLCQNCADWMSTADKIPPGGVDPAGWPLRDAP